MVVSTVYIIQSKLYTTTTVCKLLEASNEAIVSSMKATLETLRGLPGLSNLKEEHLEALPWKVRETTGS